jgi:hypothetical protein
MHSLINMSPRVKVVLSVKKMRNKINVKMGNSCSIISIIVDCNLSKSEFLKSPLCRNESHIHGPPQREHQCQTGRCSLSIR